MVNLCDEYGGPRAAYDSLGIVQLRLPTVDHFESTPRQLKEGVDFIAGFRARGEKVYVHCKAGHGRAAAMTLAWLIHTHPDEPLKASKASYTINYDISML